MKQYLSSQFGHPRGIMGWLVGQIMAIENKGRIVWTISQLDIQPGDQLLEIGIGPGLGIALAAEIVENGIVAGIDRSKTMIGLAGRRNAPGIRQGRIDLRQGDVSALPYEEGAFDKVLAINSLHHWPDPIQGLKESRRVLKPGGLVTIMEQPHGAQSEAAVRQRGDDLVELLTTAGFQKPAFILRSFSRGPAVYVTGLKAVTEQRRRMKLANKSDNAQ